jgi:hypothetical protein
MGGRWIDKLLSQAAAVRYRADPDWWIGDYD